MLAAILGDFSSGIHFLLRWLHVFFGIVWIGHLYYFNFVQGAFLNETDANAKSQVLQKLAPRALWWFRYGALWTFVLGFVMLTIRGHGMAAAGGMSVFSSPYWINILTGSLMGTLMFLNVWLIIWPKQKIVIANAVTTASGGAANPLAAGAGARATVASRTNVLFSIPMLFFMLSATHVGYNVSEASNVALYWILCFIITGGIQANAMFGKPGPIATVKGVVTCGFILTLIYSGLITILI